MAALQSGTLSSYCADVFEREPPLPTSPLLRCDDFHGTPHVGAATLEAQARVGTIIAASVLRALNEELQPGVEGDGVVVSAPVTNDPSRYAW